MKRILYIWKDKYPWDIRVEKFCKSFIDNGYEVLLLCRWKGEVQEEEIVDGISVKRVGFGKSALLTQPLSLNPVWRNSIKAIINEFKPGLIITREFFLTEAAKKYALPMKIPVIFDMAEHYPAAMKGWDKYSKNIIKRFFVHSIKLPEKLEKKAINSSDGIIVVSKELKERLLNEFTYPKEQIVEVLNTPSISEYSSITNHILSKPMRFAYHGHFSNDRNLDVLAKAFVNALKINNEISLFMAGTGESFEQVKDIVESANATKSIILYGAYKQQEMVRFLSETDVGILPYKDNTFINHIISNKLFDYMASGIPVIVSQARPMRRIINDTKSGLVVDCNDVDILTDAILKIAGMDSTELSKNALKAAEVYNWENDSKKLISFIERFIDD